MSDESIFGDLGDVLPFVDTESRNSFLAAYIPSFIEGDYTQTETMLAFRNAGVKFGDATFRNIWNEVLGLNTDASRVRFVNEASIPSDSILAVSPFDQPAEYRFRVEYDLYDDEGDYVKTKGVYVDTDDLMTRQDLETEAYYTLYGSDKGLAENAKSFRLREGWKASY